MEFCHAMPPSMPCHAMIGQGVLYCITIVFHRISSHLMTHIMPCQAMMWSGPSEREEDIRQLLSQYK